MKPLLIFKFDDYDPDKAKQFDEYIRKTDMFKKYDVIILWGGDCKVYYPFNFISWTYNKLKAWVILKIWKKKRFSNTSETM